MREDCRDLWIYIYMFSLGEDGCIRKGRKRRGEERRGEERMGRRSFWVFVVSGLYMDQGFEYVALRLLWCGGLDTLVRGEG